MTDVHGGAELLERFEASLEELERVAGLAARAALDHGSDLAVMQLGASVGDVIAIGRVFIVAQKAAADVTREFADAIVQVSQVTGNRGEWIIIRNPEWPQLDELCAVWKTWFFFVRALCDNVYRLLLAHAESRPARRGGSMGQAAGNASNPVAMILSERAPAFVPWFVAFRDRRNAVKEGVNFTCTALEAPGISISFDEFGTNPETGRRYVRTDSAKGRVTLEDVVGDIEQLVDALRVVAESFGD